jgi:hypothetical protein
LRAIIPARLHANTSRIVLICLSLGSIGQFLEPPQ